MTALGNLQIDCHDCGETLSVPVTTDPADGDPAAAVLHADHSFIAAHMATHDTEDG